MHKHETDRMKQDKIQLWILATLTSILLSLPFLIPGLGFFALLGLVPLLSMERIASILKIKHFWIYHYATFVFWNALTTYWVSNATIGGGLFAILANAFQMSLIFGLFRLSKKYFKGSLPYIFLMVMWIAWERFYFDAEISWPWLVLGNSFAGNIRSIQWYEFTGSLGGSLWIWLCNLSIFGIMVVLSDGRWNKYNIKAKIAIILGTITLFIFPFAFSWTIWNKYEEKENPLEVLILQPNIDPYNKFQAMTQAQQDDIALEQMRAFLKNRDTLKTEPLLILAPETFTSGFNLNTYQTHQSWQRFTSFLKDYPGVNLLYGASTYELIPSKEAPSHTARVFDKGIWYETHNTALIVDGTERTEFFHKSRLVVGVEYTPYPQFFTKIDDWLGGVMGRCIGQEEISLLSVVGADGEKIDLGCAVCYESVYGEYYTGYVNKGAQAMTIITNDAWWGDTPGYKQHLRYASLRAIETRRSIARSANTGVSAFINQRGEIVEQSDWWVPTTLHGKINLNDELTFYVKNGDIVGRVSTFVFLLLLLALGVRALMKSKTSEPKN